MKLLVVLTFLLASFGDMAAQGPAISKPLTQEQKSPVAQLALELTAPYVKTHDKVRAIFQWITGNIDYRVAPAIRSSAAFRRRQAPVDLDTGDVLKPLDERVAEKVLQTREAVCDGYARLFKTLCGYAGIPSEVITGYARTNGGRPGNFFRANHSWNAVFIDSSWYLLDATWAAGYTNLRGDVFVRSYDARYFLTPPAVFIRDHYPEEPSWSLLDELPAIPEFAAAPFRHSAFIRHKINAFYPTSGVIEAGVGDTILIELETADPDRKLEVWDHPFGDPRKHTSPVWLNYPERNALVRGQKISYAYTVSSPFVQWLYVVYNGESILQYRVKLRLPASAGLAAKQ